MWQQGLNRRGSWQRFPQARHPTSDSNLLKSPQSRCLQMAKQLQLQLQFQFQLQHEAVDR